ncbi:MAG: citrate synthase, partial [Candidatus Bathyarchaeum sp.]
MSNGKEYVRGLRDVAACQTRISFVDPLGALYYVGYDLDRLLGRVCYEEVIHLLLYKKLPNQKELDELKSTLTSEMKLPKEVIQTIQEAPKSSHPMEILRTEISHLGMFDPNPKDKSESANIQRALS